MIILLYVMDSLRPDFLSCYGYGKETSPHIDGLAREGVLFTHAFSQSTWTRPAGASLLSSTYPSVHGIQTLKDALPASLPLVSEHLKRRGFKTMAASTIANISPPYGFGRGFDRFIELYKEDVVVRKRKVLARSRIPVSTSEDINSFLFKFLEEEKGTNLFAFLWSLDTHDPFFHRDGSLARFSLDSGQVLWAKDIVEKKLPPEEVQRFKELYEDMIYYNDFHIGRLIERLKALDLYDETFFILTSDHGESFGENGVSSHMGAPYDHQIRVPLIMKFPHSKFSGKISGLVQHIDIVPTLLEFGGWNVESSLEQGRSLFPLLREGREVHESVFAEFQLKEWLPKYIALRTKSHKYVEISPGKLTLSYREILQRLVWKIAKPRMLFDLSLDPHETVNVVNEKRDLTESLHQRVETFKEDSLERSRDLGKTRVDVNDFDETIGKQLKALGYFE